MEVVEEVDETRWTSGWKLTGVEGRVVGVHVHVHLHLPVHDQIQVVVEVAVEVHVSVCYGLTWTP